MVSKYLNRNRCCYLSRLFYAHITHYTLHIKTHYCCAVWIPGMTWSWFIFILVFLFQCMETFGSKTFLVKREQFKHQRNNAKRLHKSIETCAPSLNVLYSHTHTCCVIVTIMCSESRWALSLCLSLSLYFFLSLSFTSRAESLMYTS